MDYANDTSLPVPWKFPDFKPRFINTGECWNKKYRVRGRHGDGSRIFPIYIRVHSCIMYDVRATGSHGFAVLSGKDSQDCGTEVQMKIADITLRLGRKINWEMERDGEAD